MAMTRHATTLVDVAELQSVPKLPLPTLIACIHDRVEVLDRVRGPVSVGCLAELLACALPYLRELEASRA